MKRITLICAGGLSTSLLVSKMKEATETLGVTIEIHGTIEADFHEFEDKTDILLLAPQVGYLATKMREKYEPRGIKIAVINSIDYGMMNGEKVLKDALVM